jgi:hypothetical protein
MTIHQPRLALSANQRRRDTPHRLPLPVVIFVLLFCVPGTIAFYVGSFLITPYRVYMMVMTPVLLAKLFSDRRLRLTDYDYLFFAFAAWSVMCICMNAENPTERAGMFLLQSISAYILARASLRSFEDLQGVVKLMFKVVVVALVLAIPEAMSHKKFILDITSAFTGVRVGQYADGHDIRFGIRRAQAFFANPILYGLFCSSIASLTWYTGRTTPESVKRLFIVASAMILAVSSGPLLAFNLQLLLMLVEFSTREIKQRWTFILAMSGVGFILIQMGTGGGLFGLVVNYLSFNTGSAYNRVAIWNWGLVNIVKHPLFGREGWEYGPYMKASLDNYWIAITIQGGIPCLVFLLLATLILMLKLGKVPGAALSPAAGAFRNAWFFSIIALMFTGFSVMFFGEIQPLFFFLLGMAGTMVPIYDRQAKAFALGRSAGHRRVRRSAAPFLREEAVKHRPNG